MVIREDIFNILHVKKSIILSLATYQRKSPYVGFSVS